MEEFDHFRKFIDKLESQLTKDNNIFCGNVTALSEEFFISNPKEEKIIDEYLESVANGTYFRKYDQILKVQSKQK